MNTNVINRVNKPITFFEVIWIYLVVTLVNVALISAITILIYYVIDSTPLEISFIIVVIEFIIFFLLSFKDNDPFIYVTIIFISLCTTTILLGVFYDYILSIGLCVWFVFIFISIIAFMYKNDTTSKVLERNN